LEVFLGLSCSGSGAATGAGTTWLREALCDESTPKKTDLLAGGDHGGPAGGQRI